MHEYFLVRSKLCFFYCYSADHRIRQSLGIGFSYIVVTRIGVVCIAYILDIKLTNKQWLLLRVLLRYMQYV